MTTMSACDVVNQAFAFYLKGDWDGVASLCAKDCVWSVPASRKAGIPWIGDHHGAGEVKEKFLKAMEEHVRVDSEFIKTARTCLSLPRKCIETLCLQGSMWSTYS